jgi:hypothetical protein
VKNSSLFIAVLLSGTAFAQENWCKMNSNPPTQRYELDVQPSWFISADPNGRYVGVIGSGNHVYDLQSTSGPKSIQVPGSYDPVFTPDGKYLTIPGGEFYDANKIRAALNSNQGSYDTAPIGSEDGAAATPYQSIGILSESAQRTSYMYISDVREGDSNANLEYFIADVDHSTKKLTTRKKGTFCSNIPTGNTPMISQDGKYVSVLNHESRSTQIYKINLDGDCPMMVDLGVPTGKVSFDFSTNPRKVAFHVDRASTNVTWFSGLGEGITKDTYVMDLAVERPGAANEKWKITGVQRLGVHTEDGTGTYYPRFRKDGTLVAISWDKNNRSINDSSYRDTHYYLDVFNLQRGQTNKSYDAALMSDPFCDDGKLEDKAFAPLALAFLWKDACDSSGLADRYRDSLLLTPAMDRNACIQLVDRFWSQKKEAFLSSPVNFDQFQGTDVRSVNRGSVRERSSAVALAYGPNELKAACPAASGRTPTNDTTAVSLIDRVVETKPDQLIMNKCGGCHDTEHPNAGLAFQNGHDLNRTDTADTKGVSAATAPMMLNAIWKDRMPPAGSENLRSADKKAMTKYLLDFVDPARRAQIETRIRNMGGSW